jgi:hypothetical protein
MIDELDEVLRQLLIREIPIKNGEVDIKFEQPKREWSSRLSRPTLNLFLYDVRENSKLRQAQPMWHIERNQDGTATRRLKPVRVDLHYMITAWTSDPEDEHRLLASTLLALFRNPNLPEELLPESFENQPAPVSVMAAQEDELQNPADVWSSLDNELRPAITCVVTLALDPYHPISGPIVRTRELRMGQATAPLSQQLDGATEPDTFWTIGGTVRSHRPLEKARLTLVERGLDVPLQLEGGEQTEARFSIGRLEAGDYTLEVAVDGGQPRRYKISVPSPDYDLEV